jgi:hypothetical protein
MNANDYKQICSRPDVLQRAVLEQTARVIQIDLPAHAEHIESILGESPVSKPAQHNGGNETDYFYIDLSDEEAGEIIEYLLEKEAGAIGVDGNTTAEASSLGRLVDLWTQYISGSGGEEYA